MRIQRCEAERKDHPEKLNLYDDVAVAYDRIHKDDKALLWIERKKAMLTQSSSKLDWYRYYANAGTFHAHHWFATRPKQADELKIAEAQIEKAIELNPGAHE